MRFIYSLLFSWNNENQYNQLFIWFIAELGFRYCCETGLYLDMNALSGKKSLLLVWDSIENLVLQHLNFGPAWNLFVWIASLIIISQYFFPRRLSRLPLSCHCWPYCFQRSLVENTVGKVISQGLDASSDYWGAYATRSVCCISF